MLIAVSTGVVLLLVLGLSAISINYMTSAQESMINITENHNTKIDLLSDMGKLVRERSLRLHAMYFNEDLWRRSEEFEKFSNLAPEFIKLRDGFRKLELTKEEKDIFNEAMRLISITQSLQLDIRDKLLGDHDKQARKMIAEKDLPMENKLLSVFDKLVTNLREASKKASDKTRVEFQFSIVLFFSVALAIIIVVCVGAFFVGRRITSSENKLFEEKERAEVTLNTIVNGVITTDVSGKILMLNPAAANMIEWEQDTAWNKQLEDVYCIYQLGSDDVIDRKEFCKVIDGPCMHTTHHHRLIGRSGREIIVEETVSPIFDTSQNIIQFSYTFRDVSYERGRTDQALRDSLTGAMNRRFMETEMQRLIHSANEMDVTHGFLYIDIDFFKQINDTHGHTAGDKVLYDLAAIMLSKIRQKDVLVRLGGDEFVVLVKNCDLETARLIAEKILESINGYSLTYKEKTLGGFSASIGLSMIRSGTKNSDQILDEADRACYEVKESGRNGLRVCSAY